jgi:hypothetical protein
MEEKNVKLNRDVHPVFTNDAITPFFNVIGGTKEEEGMIFYVDAVPEEGVPVSSEDLSAQNLLSIKLFSKSVKFEEICVPAGSLISEISTRARHISFGLGQRHAERHPELANAKIELTLPEPKIEIEPRPAFMDSPIDWFMSFFRPRKEIHRVIEYTRREKEGILRRKILTKIFHISNIIAVNSRRGPANKIIVSVSMGTILQDMEGFTFANITGEVNLMPAASIYRIGFLAGMEVFVDTLMKFNDTRILVYKCGNYKDKNQEVEPGLKLIYKEDSLVIDDEHEKVMLTIEQVGQLENNYFLLNLEVDIMEFF